MPDPRARLVAEDGPVAWNQDDGARDGREEDTCIDFSANPAHCKLNALSTRRNNNNNNNNHKYKPHHHKDQSQCTATTTTTTTKTMIQQQQQQQYNSRSSRQSQGSSPLERLTTLLLPFVCVFLLPTIKLAPHETPLEQRSGLGNGGNGAADGMSLLEANQLFGGVPTASSSAAHNLLLALIRYPFDKIRLQLGDGAILAAECKEIISSKSDLQEEETHMMLLAPAEHRSSYASAGGPNQAPTGGAGYHYNQAGGEGGAGNGGEPVGGQMHGGEAHAQVMPAPGDYGPDSSDQSGPVGGGGGVGQGEATVVAESATGPHNGANSLQTRSDLPAVRALNVKCEKNHMTVNIVFDRPFYGMVFSKGHYNDQKCVHLKPSSGQTSVNFDIHLGKCGMSSSDAGNGLQQAGGSNGLQQGGTGNQQQQPNGVFIENTIIIQYDPLVQEIYDQARKLRCTWYDYYEKSVTFKPYNVDMLDAVTANFLGDNIQCWMQIQVGKGPWSSEVAGIVKIGQTMTMVLAIKDDENRFDMLVRNCVAHDGKHQPIQLVDEYGCVARPKIMGKFQKVRNFGPAATVVSYAHFQAFKFPDSMNVHFQCVIQVCRYECPEPACTPGQKPGPQEPYQLSGPTGGGLGLAGPSGDYATSGTEIVASKELVPHHQSIVGGGGYQPAAGIANQSLAHHHSLHHHSQQHHGSNVNLKLDESQGRVQVKLDTSMMAALGSNGRPSVVATNAASGSPHTSGPLPPHLLHSGQPQSQAQQPQELVSRSYPVAGGGNGLFRAPPMTSSQSQTVGLTSGQMRNPSAQQQLVSFSPPFPPAQVAAASHRSAAYMSRLGETMASNGDQLDKQTTSGKQQQLQHTLDQLAPYEAEYPLSLIASPRGFLLGAGNIQKPIKQQLHRVKRANAAAGQSTSVQTHKSIQVVSPDDVAFSLLEPDESVAAVTRRRVGSTIESSSQPSSSVCFSASRFLWTVLVTLTALISGIVIVTYVILRQRSQLEQKLSTVYSAQDPFQPPPGISFNYPTTATMVSQGSSPSLQHSSSSSSSSSNNSYLHLGSGSAAAAAALERRLVQQTICSENNKRQQEEVQQRNKYLARLYSQFSPASYWR